MARKKKKPSEPKNSTIWIILVIVLILELFAITWCRIQYTQTSIDMAHGLREQKKLKLTQDKLIIEQARLKSSKRLIRIAKKQSGLVMPAQDQIYIMK